MADLLENFDIKLQEFYKDALQKIIKKKGVKKTEITTVLRNRKKISNSSLNSSLSHWTAYLFRYGPLYTSAVSNHLSRMVEKNSTLFRDIFRKGSIHICCLGGNLALEVVALSQIVTCVQYRQSTVKPLHLKITAMDKNRQWKDTALDVIQALTEKEDMFDASKVAVSFEFVRANFPKPLENDAVEVLREADIVTMVNFPNPTAPLTNTSSLIQDISARMKEGAVLFYLNTGVNRRWELVEKSLGVSKCIYEPVQLEAFTLNLNSVQRCISLFWRDYSSICVTSCIINSCAWVKKADAKYDYKKACSRMAKRRWEKKKELSQRTLEEFHSKIQEIVPKRTMKKKDLNEGSLLTDASQKICKKVILFSTKGKDRRISL